MLASFKCLEMPQNLESPWLMKSQGCSKTELCILNSRAPEIYRTEVFSAPRASCFFRSVMIPAQKNPMDSTKPRWSQPAKLLVSIELRWPWPLDLQGYSQTEIGLECGISGRVQPLSASCPAVQVEDWSISKCAKTASRQTLIQKISLID